MRSWKVAFVTIAVAVIVIAFLVLRRGDALIGGTAGAAMPNPATIAMPVPVTKIVKKAVPIYLDYSARTESIRNIALQAKVSGYIRQQHVPDGTDVEEGDLLYTIDPRDFQAALDQAKAQAQRDVAALDYAHSNLDRGSTLAKSGRPSRPKILSSSSPAHSMRRASLFSSCLPIPSTWRSFGVRRGLPVQSAKWTRGRAAPSASTCADPMAAYVHVRASIARSSNPSGSSTLAGLIAAIRAGAGCLRARS